eukprot:g23895.t1
MACHLATLPAETAASMCEVNLPQDFAAHLLLERCPRGRSSERAPEPPPIPRDPRMPQPVSSRALMARRTFNLPRGESDSRALTADCKALAPLRQARLDAPVYPPIARWSVPRRRSPVAHRDLSLTHWRPKLTSQRSSFQGLVHR